MSTSLVPGRCAAATFVIANGVLQFHVIVESILVNTTSPVLVVTPKAGIDPVPVQPVLLQLTPDTNDVRATEQVTDALQA